LGSNIRAFGSRQEWLEARRGYIGGSDAPIILGVTSWSSPLQVWHQKIGAAEIEYRVLERQKWGNRLEAAIREAYTEETGRGVTADPPHSFRVSEEHPIIAASLDGIVPEAPGQDGPGVLQIKCADAFTKAKWKDEAPLEYQVQVQHEMAATGFNWASIAVLMGGNTFFYFDVPRDQTFIDAMIAEEYAFWQCVETGTPPAPSGAEDDGRILASLYGVKSGSSITLGADALALHEQLTAAKEAEKEAKKVIDLSKQLLLSMMGEAELAVLPDGSGYKRTERFRDGYTVQPTSFTELRYVKKKKS